MARYVYECPNGHVSERFMPICDRKDRIRCGTCKKLAYQRPGAQVAPPATWAEPVLSDAMGVHPDQIHEAQQHSVSIGVPTQFNKLGQAVFTSRQHRRDYCRHFGVHDLDGGYGDP